MSVFEEGAEGAEGTLRGWLRTAPQKRRESMCGCKPWEFETGPHVLQELRIGPRQLVVVQTLRHTLGPPTLTNDCHRGTERWRFYPREAE